jgi:hypothetical protein
VSLSYASSAASSGVLTVTSGGSVVAAIDFSGSYTTSSFRITSGTSGTVEIADPPVVSTASLVSAAHHDGDDGVDHGDGDSGPVMSRGQHISGNGNSSLANDSALLTYAPLKQAVSMLLSNSDQQTSLLWGNNAKLHAEMIASLHDARSQRAMIRHCFTTATACHYVRPWHHLGPTIFPLHTIF